MTDRPDLHVIRPGEPTGARADYPLERLRSAPAAAAEQWERMCDEIDTLRLLEGQARELLQAVRVMLQQAGVTAWPGGDG